MASPENNIELSTGQKERVIGVTAAGQAVNMEVVVPCRFAYRCVVDTNQWKLYEGWAMAGTTEADTAWMVCKHTYDANGNLTATEWASVDYSKDWSNYAAHVYS